MQRVARTLLYMVAAMLITVAKGDTIYFVRVHILHTHAIVSVQCVCPHYISRQHACLHIIVIGNTDERLSVYSLTHDAVYCIVVVVLMMNTSTRCSARIQTYVHIHSHIHTHEYNHTHAHAYHTYNNTYTNIPHA